MQNNDTIKRHAALVDRMSTALGHDLEEAVFRGEISVDEIGDAVLRCTKCSNPGDCAHWLDAQGAERAEVPPGYCRNGDVFAALDRVAVKR